MSPAEFSARVLDWFARHGRKDLPWQAYPTPYRVWISEIMLQQTQVKTVIPYYNRFLERFPDLSALAAASEQQVLELWSGLGYYQRARNLYSAAKQMLRVHRKFPEEFEAILSLPGIGRYTAGAICSIALNQPRPVVDGNIRRVLIRLHAIQGHAPESYFWNLMSAWLPENNASSFNQAMMELGALVCLPIRPLCPQCPARNLCAARKLGIQNLIPASRPKRAARHLRIATLVLEKNARILLAPPEKLRFIPGKWGLPCRLIHHRESAEEAASILCRDTLGYLIPLTCCAHVRHSISSYRISAYAFCGKPGSPGIALPKTGKHQWSSGSLRSIRLISSLFHKILQKYSEKRDADPMRRA
jgi:A/G-specific adenine glycosylase